MEDIGMAPIGNAEIPVVIGGKTIRFRALTIGEWSGIMGGRIGRRVSAYLESVDDESLDMKQVEDVLLDCTYPSDFTKLSEDEFSQVLLIGARGLTLDLVGKHKRAIQSIIYTLNFGGLSEGGERRDRPETWFGVVGMMCGLLSKGVDPLALRNMTILQIAAIGDKMERDKQRAEMAHV